MEHLASSRPETGENTDVAPVETDKIDTRRRQSLLKLGIATGVVYAAPTVLRIDRNLANAAKPSENCNNGGGNGTEGCDASDTGNDDGDMPSP